MIPTVRGLEARRALALVVPVDDRLVVGRLAVDGRGGKSVHPSVAVQDGDVGRVAVDGVLGATLGRLDERLHRRHFRGRVTVAAVLIWEGGRVLCRVAIQHHAAGEDEREDDDDRREQLGRAVPTQPVEADGGEDRHHRIEEREPPSG